MFKLTLLVWLILGTVVAGVAMATIVSVPALAEQSSKLIPWLCGGGFLLAIPLSYMVARAISAGTRGTARG